MKQQLRGVLILITIFFVFIVSILLNSGSNLPYERLEELPPDREITPERFAIREYTDQMIRALDSTGTVGAAFTIVHNGRIISTRTHGVRRQGSSAKVNRHTVFRLASVSKGFSGALACLLQEEEILSLDDRVSEYLPGFMLKDSVSTAELTLRHVMSHTSGLVPHAYDNLVEADMDLASIIGRLHEVDISAPPGELYGYQNVVFSILAPVSEQRTGKSYGQLLEEKLFRPLGMEDASAGRIDLDDPYNVAFPHVIGKDGYKPMDLHDGYYNVLPAAGINASIADMGQWLLALLGYQPEHFPDTVCRQLSTPLVYTPLKWQYTRHWKPFRARYYSLGWRIYHYQGRKIVYHGGYVRGYRAEIGYCPEEKVGIAFLQNSPNGLASQSVPTFFDLFFQTVDGATKPVNGGEATPVNGGEAYPVNKK
jgi:beta-lactamase class C